MRYLPRRGDLRRIVAPVLALACLAAGALPAEAGVRAFRVANGSEDASFVALGAASTVARTVPDGRHGVYLIGHIVVGGGQRQIVHLRPDGSADPAFRPRLQGGRVIAAALAGGTLVIAGTFTAVAGEPRAGLAALDARSGRPLGWTPRIPLRVPSRTWGDVVFAGSTLLVSAQHRVYGWRPGESTPAWTDLLDSGQAPAQLVRWRGKALALAEDAARNVPALYRVDATTGRLTALAGSFDHVESLQAIGGRLVGLDRGSVEVLFDASATHRVASCGHAAAAYVAAITGDAHTLYAGDSPMTLDVPGSVPGISACSFGAPKPGFRAPALRYGVHGPVVGRLALVGTHILVFTQRF